MRHVPTSSKIVALVSEFVYNANSTTDNGSMIIDSGASCHIIKSEEMAARMTNTRTTDGQISMNGHNEPIVLRGDLVVQLTCSKKSMNKAFITLRDVAYVPTSEHNLFSSSSYLKSHHLRKPDGAPDNHLVQTYNEMFIGGIEDNERRIYGKRDGNLWFLKIQPGPKNERAYTGDGASESAPSSQLQQESSMPKQQTDDIDSTANDQ
jgi:hypothetical protein